MTTLAGRTIVVFGASGNVGFGVASALLDAGAKVVLPARSEESLHRIGVTFAGRDAHPVLGDVSDGVDAERLARAIGDTHGPIHHVVASLGAWWNGGRLLGQSSDAWTEVRGMLLDSHVHAARTMLPLLETTGGSYVIVTGEGAVRPIPAASLLTIALGGTLALSRLLRSDRSLRARVNEVRIAARVEVRPRPGVVPAHAFGEAMREVLASDVRSAVIPFASLETFDVHRALPDG